MLVSLLAYGFHPFSRPETTSDRQRGPGKMSDTMIFVVGLFVTLLFAGGIIFSILEFRRMGDEAAPKRL